MRKIKGTRKIFAFLIALLLSINCSSVVFAGAQPTLKVHFLNVTYGDSILITCGKEAMLVDFGRKDMGSRVCDYVKKQKITNLKYAVGTHPHHDHLGGMLEVVNTFNINTIMLTPSTNPDNPFLSSDQYKNTLDAIQEKQINTIYPRPGSTYNIGQAKFKFLAPLKAFKGINNSSLVMKLTYKKNSFMLVGDAEKESESAMIKKYGKSLKADVLKLGHHGKADCTSEAFLKKVKPRWAVISCGRGHIDIGKPANSVLKLLKKHKIKNYRTDTQGNIIATCDGKKIKWTTGK